ncbi:MAG TPA: acetylglutamate kinase [Vicinamibacterales bacterium]
MISVLKLGGELLEDSGAMRAAASGIASLRVNGPVAIVHGGGRAIDADLRARGKSPRFVDGLRITDQDTLDTVVGVLAGRMNTSFVAALSSAGIPAVGLTGADARLGHAAPAPPLRSASGSTVELGRVGVPLADAPARLLLDLLALGYVPVVASIGVMSDGTLLNVNADVMAAHLARAIEAGRLIVAGSTPGVFDADGRTCLELDEASARTLVSDGAAREGMVAKLSACLEAIASGVREVRIIDGRGGDFERAVGTTIRANAAAAALQGSRC